jgi:hypothetical protein
MFGIGAGSEMQDVGVGHSVEQGQNEFTHDWCPLGIG